MNQATAPARNRPSAFQPLDEGDEWPPEPSRASLFLSELIRQTGALAVRSWQSLSRKTRIVIIGLLMTSCSFSLSMIVSILSE